MRVIFTGGGTGGHIYPIMAIIDRLKEEKICSNDEILFVGTQKGLESKIVPAAGVNFKTINIQGFNRKHPLKNFKTIELFFKATKSAKKIIKEFKPDIVLGTGGYVSGAMVYEAAKMHIPTMIHESNSVVGLANKFLGHFVDRICYSFDDATKQFSEKKKLVKTGNPRSQQVLGLNNKKIDLKESLDLDPEIPTVLVFGGSRGALAINRIMLQSLMQLKKKPYQVIWATGTFYYDAVQKKLKDVDLGTNIKILPYIKDMPSPNVTHNHQMKNAMDLEKSGAALVLSEDDLNPNNFVSSIDHILLDEKYAKQMSHASKALGVPNASDQVIKVMQELTNK